MICEQAPNFFNEILCGFRKAHSTQHASFELITSWQTSLRRGGFVGSILMDLSKTYDCLKAIYDLQKTIYCSLDFKLTVSVKKWKIIFKLSNESHTKN